MGHFVKYIDLEFVTLLYGFRDGVVSFSFVPKSKKDSVHEFRMLKSNNNLFAYSDPMFQISCHKDAFRREFHHGQTLFNSSSSFDLKFDKQEVIKQEKITYVNTYFKSERLSAKHVVKTISGYEAFEIYNEVTALSDDVEIDKIDSATINCLSPLMEENNQGNLIYHEIQSYWSMEGRLRSFPVSQLTFEDSWIKFGTKVHRIGSLGLMPARGHHPFVAIEDKENKVTWALQLEAPDSWQIELIHHFGAINISAGHSDYLFGHWRKKLKKGETFITKKAYVTACQGDIDIACSNITAYHDNLIHSPSNEEELPIIYSEYLYSWGKPFMKDISKQLPIAREYGCEEFVIDAGWFNKPNEPGEYGLGDWEVNKDKFPNGLSQFSKEAQSLGFKNYGVWYEFEATMDFTKVFNEHPEYIVTLDGQKVILDHRCFLDLNKEEVRNYLYDKVINTLKKNNLNYLKLDYNENIGYEIDGPDENKAENVRLYVENVQNFIKLIQKEIPGFVFEVCSAGGMRHEVSFDYIGSMTSFSDAHETLNGVIIAMDLHRIMQPRIMQVWASLLPSFSSDEVYVVLAKSMLGRMCLSGKLDELSNENKALIKKAVSFYQEIKSIIKYGNSFEIDTSDFVSIDHLHGFCLLKRRSRDGSKMVTYYFNLFNKEVCIKRDISGYSCYKYFGNTIVDNENIIFPKDKLCTFVGLYLKK